MSPHTWGFVPQTFLACMIAPGPCKVRNGSVKRSLQNYIMKDPIAQERKSISDSCSVFPSRLPNRSKRKETHTSVCSHGTAVVEHGVSSFVVEVELVSVQGVDVRISHYTSTPQSSSTPLLKELDLICPTNQSCAIHSFYIPLPALMIEVSMVGGGYY